MSLRLVFTTLFLSLHAWAAQAQAWQVGFERRTTADGTELGIWFPASGTSSSQRLGLYAQDIVPGARVVGRHSLIVISHGTSGDFGNHVDTAMALARAGFIVAALTHPGDNWRDSSRATEVVERPVALSATISYMLGAWPSHAAIDPRRIGAFGFSSGGFTVLVAAGGHPDLSRLAAHCAQHPDFFDCNLTRTAPRAGSATWPDLRDRRIKAIVVAAPALGFTFTHGRLAGVRVPVQLWRADSDRVLPAPFYADAVKAALPGKPEFHGVPGADHFDFTAVCVDPRLMPRICQSGPGFDRAAFHARFNAEIVRFFSQKLKGR